MNEQIYVLIYNNGSIQWMTEINTATIINLLTVQSLRYCIDVTNKKAMLMTPSEDGKNQNVVWADIPEWKTEIPVQKIAEPTPIENGTAPLQVIKGGAKQVTNNEEKAPSLK